MRDNVRSDGHLDEAVVYYGPEVDGPHVADSPEQYAAAANALALVGFMWGALLTDDDQTIVKVILPETLARLGDYQLRPAARVREVLGVSKETCRVMGCASTVRVLADGSFVVLSVKLKAGFGGIDEYTDGLTAVRGWVLLIAKVQGRWWIAGHPYRGPGHQVVGLIDVIPPSELPLN
jgi:hypothetical protein